MPNQEMPKSAYAMYKAAFREQKRAPIAVSMTTYCESLCVRYGSMIYRPRRCNWRIQPPSNGHQRVKYENRRLGRSQERRLTSLPKVTTRRRCNDVEIERIGTSHTTVSQQAEQVRIVTGQRTTQKDDGIRRKIVCR